VPPVPPVQRVRYGPDDRKTGVGSTACRKSSPNAKTSATPAPSGRALGHLGDRDQVEREERQVQRNVGLERLWDPARDGQDAERVAGEAQSPSPVRARRRVESTGEPVPAIRRLRPAQRTSVGAFGSWGKLNTSVVLHW
jgi:hypothetical protein